MAHFLAPLVAEPQRTWRLRNLTSGHELAARLEAAFDSASRKRGLLGRDRFEPGAGLVIAPCGGIHTWFMRFPIDVVFASRDGRVVKVRTAVQPWRLALAPTAFCVIELPANVARASGTRAGDRLALVAAADEADPAPPAPRA